MNVFKLTKTLASSLNATINSLISSSLSSESTLSTTGVILSNLSTHAFNFSRYVSYGAIITVSMLSVCENNLTASSTLVLVVL